MRHKRHQLLIFLFSILCFGTVAGIENEEVPDLEFLIFLGTFEDVNGNWQDPLEIEKMSPPKDQPDLNDKEISEESGDE